MSAPRERTENASKENQSAFSFDDDLKMLAEEFDELSFMEITAEILSGKPSAKSRRKLPQKSRCR